jgi:SAM-dependent methyltransferase
MEATDGEEYTRRLVERGGAPWKRFLNVQAPYQWNLRRRDLGRTLDVGCGIGRNLPTLAPGSVGVDQNATSVALARENGLQATTADEFFTSAEAAPASFDGILLSHVIEHMSVLACIEMMQMYLSCLKPGGKVLLICPQERGYASDPTHVRWTTGEDMERLAHEVRLVPERWTSFPLPRAFGRVFTYNEFNVLARKPF